MLAHLRIQPRSSISDITKSQHARNNHRAHFTWLCSTSSDVLRSITMFSPDASAPAPISVRNPRRRQRNGSEDSVALHHNPKRIRRSILASETFQPPEEITKLNGSIGHIAEGPYLNGHVREAGSQRHSSADTTSLAIRHRGVKKADRDRRSSKHDGSVELVCFPMSQ